MSLIRKITIKIDKDNVMHYQVGSKVFGGAKIVSDIIREGKFFDIYVREADSEVKMIWKSFNVDSVEHIEYETDL
jgi:hypothetical protein